MRTPAPKKTDFERFCDEMAARQPDAGRRFSPKATASSTVQAAKKWAGAERGKALGINR